jgi:hypothetical protein
MYVSNDAYKDANANSMEKVSDRRRSQREALVDSQEVFVRSMEAVPYSAS